MTITRGTKAEKVSGSVAAEGQGRIVEISTFKGGKTCILYVSTACVYVCEEGEEASRDCVVAVLAMVFEEWVTTGFAGSYRISACGCGARAVGGLAR